MKSTKAFFVILVIMMSFSLFAIPVSLSKAKVVAEHQLTKLDSTAGFSILNDIRIIKQTDILSYCFDLNPIGYIIISADDEMPPVIAYSTTSTFQDVVHQNNILEEIIKDDLSLRLKNISSISVNINKEKWAALVENHLPERFQQWPPEGTTASGGWLKTNWTQSAPYNNDCPMDNVTGARSQAGCPAVAMAQIVNYYACINGTTFSDSDDYHHSYSGNNYWIDNDSALFGFPSFPELNADLATMMHHYRYQEVITDSDKAAIVFACGVAAHQVYASDGSGTFSVNQALQAYHKFGFQAAQLESEDIPELYLEISANIINAKPVHLAIESQDQTTGHNVVVDGYNTDGYFHLNFGWGSAYDGWYLLPSELPFGLTMIEGAIVNIEPIAYISVSPDTLDIQSPIQINHPYEITIHNIYSESDVIIENYYFDATFAGIAWEVQHEDFPKVIAPGDSTTFSLIPQTQGNNSGNLYQTLFRIILDKAAKDVLIQYQSPVHNVDVNHSAQHSILINSVGYPNPCSASTHLDYQLLKQAMVTASIFNAKGELINQLVHEMQPTGLHKLSWNGTDKHGNKVASGIYFYRISADNEMFIRKLIFLK